MFLHHACRASLTLLPLKLPLLQGHELLAQEVREAFLNAKLADHAGEPWARLDVAGCELRPSSAHAEALAEVGAEAWAALPAAFGVMQNDAAPLFRPPIWKQNYVLAMAFVKQQQLTCVC